MAKKNFYVVKVGRKPGVYLNWSDCEKQVKGFKGALFKGFNSESDAEEYQKSGYQPKKAKKTPGLPKFVTGIKFWLEPGYDTRLKDGVWNTEKEV